MAGEALPLANDVERAYGCVFCVTGKEQTTAKHIEYTCDDVRAIVARQLIVREKTDTVEKVLYPGYVFFDAPVCGEMLRKIPKDDNILSILKSGADDWRLYGNDAMTVAWLFSYDGLIPFSQAYKEGDWIRIISGPLKDLQKQIIRMDKHRKSALVSITLCNREVKTWLKFELVEKI